MRIRTQSLVLTLLFSLLSGCSSLAPTPDDNFWSFDGKVSVRQAGETRVLSIHWTQTAGRSDIRLSAALGAASADLTVENGLIRVESGDIDEYYPTDGHVVLGGQSYPMPVTQLVYWLRGKQDAGGRPLVGEIERSGWRVKLLRSDDLGPRLLQLAHPDASLKLSIKRWRFEPPTARTQSNAIETDSI